MDTESMSTDKIQVGRHFSKSLQTDSSPYLLLFDLAETVLLISPSASLGWFPSLSLCTSLPAQGCFLSTSLSLSPFSLSLSLLAPLSLSLLPHLLSSSWICFTLHCSRPREDPGWMSHPLTICCPKALQVSATSKDPTAVHEHARVYIYACLHTAN